MVKSKRNKAKAQSEMNDEFGPRVMEDFDIKKLKGLSRRKFLALMGASSAFAATACTNYRDKGEIIPYTRKPEEIQIGKANYYSSTCNACPLVCGILIKTREGRPIKILGNPDHPVNQGKICAIGEANILNLYDPERIKTPLVLMGNGFLNGSWNNVEQEIVEELNKASESNKEISIITHTINSSTLNKLFEDFKAKFPTTKIYSYEFFDEGNRKKAWEKSYGNSNFPLIEWNKAQIILALDADFIGNEGHFIEQMRMFTENRNVDELNNFSRLYIAEAGLSLTGANADIRFRLRPELHFDFVMSLTNEILKQTTSAISLESSIVNQIKNYSLETFAKTNSLSLPKLKTLVNDLIKNKGKSIVYAGFKLDESTHVAVNLLNEILGNKELYNSNSGSVELMQLSDKSEIQSLIDRMNTGKVEVVIHFDTNPVFHFPKDFGYENALKKVNKIITLAESQNETSAISHIVLPINHCLESWGDYQTRTCLYSLQQPVIAPLYTTRQKEAIILNWMNGKPEYYIEDNYHKYLMNFWEKEIYPKTNSALDFKTFWYSALHDGIISINEESKKIGNFNLGAFHNLVKNPVSNGYTIILQKNYFIGDGRFANNGWLQEIPHPITKITWDNYASVSTATAKELNLEIGNKIEVKVNGTSLILPVMVQPGLADKVISIELGYGRTVIGDVGKEVGANANLFMTKEQKPSEWFFTNGNITKVNGKYMLAATQEHHKLDEEFVKDLQFKRHIIRESTVTKYKTNPYTLGKKEHALPNINREIKYPGVKWAMAIDLNKCTGCSRCVAACNVENNIVVVGKEQVSHGRAMQWLRI
ncbi:MAG: molybdopterin-dependent oxidoreductase, partial [FCB group bacterium]